MMIEFKEMLVYLQEYLDKHSNLIVQDLLNLDIKLFYGKTDPDIANYIFEYSYEYLTITLFLMDSSFNEVATSVRLPSSFVKNNSYPSRDDKDSNYFIPYKLEQFEMNIEDEYDDSRYTEDEFYDAFDEYQTQKTRLFESWFVQCWQQAQQLTNATTKSTAEKVNSYFSVHDTYYKLHLNTMKTVTTDDIETNTPI